LNKFPKSLDNDDHESREEEKLIKNAEKQFSLHLFGSRRSVPFSRIYHSRLLDFIYLPSRKETENKFQKPLSERERSRSKKKEICLAS
jgi:hypothetical protein